MVAPRQPAPRPAGRHVVARTDEIPPGERIIVEIDGRQVGVFNVDGEYVAFLHRCPHMGGPLCDGRVISLVESSGPGDVRLDETRKFLTCPLHGWEFDIHTGQSYFDPAKVRAKRYPVEVRSGADLAADGSTGDVAGDAAGAAAGDAAGSAAGDTAGGAKPAVTDPARAEVGGRIRGPYTAETFEVVVEQDYVVVRTGRPRRT